MDGRAWNPCYYQPWATGPNAAHRQEKCWFVLSEKETRVSNAINPDSTFTKVPGNYSALLSRYEVRAGVRRSVQSRYARCGRKRAPGVEAGHPGVAWGVPPFACVRSCRQCAGDASGVYSVIKWIAGDNSLIEYVNNWGKAKWQVRPRP